MFYHCMEDGISMERSFYGSALVLGVIVWFCCLMLTRGESKKRFSAFLLRIPNAYLFAAIGVPLLGFLATLPSHPPFASGHGLGKGLLLGALGAWLTAWTVGRSLDTEKNSIEKNSAEKSHAQSGAAFVAPLALGVVFTSIPLLLMRDIVVDALMGTAIGWLTVTLLLLAGLNAAGISARVTGLALLVGTGFTATVCSLVALGELGGNARFGNTLVPLHWSAPLIALSACVPFLLLLSSLISFRALNSWLAMVNKETCRWLVAGGLLLFVGTQFAHKIGFVPPPLFRLLAIGWVTSGLCWWLALTSLRSARENGSVGIVVSWQSFAVPVLLFMAAGMVAFQLFAGVGVGIFLLGAWLTVGIALLGAAEEVSAAGIQVPTENSVSTDNSVLTYNSFSLAAVSHLIRLLIFGTILLLYRLFQVRFSEDLHNISLSDHYAFLGFIVGAALPAAMTGCIRQAAKYKNASEFKSSGSNSSEAKDYGSQDSCEFRASLLSVLVMGALVLFVPALLLLLFGTKCLLCLFFGLALAAVLSDSVSQALPFVDTPPGDVPGQVPPRSDFKPVSGEMLAGLFALAMGLALTQWTHLLIPITLMARADKMHLLTSVAASAVALLVISEIGSRLRRSVKRGGRG